MGLFRPLQLYGFQDHKQRQLVSGWALLSVTRIPGKLEMFACDLHKYVQVFLAQLFAPCSGQDSGYVVQKYLQYYLSKDRLV